MPPSSQLTEGRACALQRIIPHSGQPRARASMAKVESGEVGSPLHPLPPTPPPPPFPPKSDDKVTMRSGHFGGAVRRLPSTPCLSRAARRALDAPLQMSAR